MANLSKDIQCACSNTRPSMVDRTDFASWQQRIRLYCRGKENGVNILKSIDKGPFQMGMFRETLTEGEEGAFHLGPERPRVYSDLSPKDKERFTKLINDMRNIKITMPKMQLNSKFVNDMLPKWGRFITAVTLNRGLKESNYDQLYAYLKQHEVHANENKMILERFTQYTVDPLALMSTVLPYQYFSQSSTTLPSTHAPLVTHQLHFAYNTQLDSGLSPTNNLIENLTNTLALLTQSYKTYLPSKQSTQNVIKYKEQIHSSRRHGCCSRSTEQSSDKMLLMHAQENGVMLDEEQLLFIAGGQDNVVDKDVDETSVQDFALNTMFMANLSFADPVYDEAGPSYDSNILSEVHDPDNYQDAVCELHEVHEMHDNVQPNCVVDSDADYTSDSKTIPYDKYVKYNAEPVVQNNLSFVPNDASMKIINEMQEQTAQCVSVKAHTKVVEASLIAKLVIYYEQVKLYERRAKFELTEREQKIEEQLRIVITDRNIKEENLTNKLHSVKMQLNSTINYNKSMVEEVTSLKKDFKQKENKYLEEFLDMKALKEKQVQPALYNGHEIIKTHHVPTIIHNSEDTLEIAEITRKKMNDKMKTPLWTEQNINIRPPDYSKENYLATFTPQIQLTPEQIFWSKDVIKIKAKALKEQTKSSKPIKALTMKCDEIERKNLLIANDNLIVDCLSKEMFYIATNSELTISRFTEMHDAHTVVQVRCLELEAELSKLNDKIQKDDHNELVKRFSNLEVNHLNLQLKHQHLKESFGNNKFLPARDTPDFDSVFVIVKIKASFQEKDNAIKKLRMQISQLKETRSEADRTLDFRALDFQITKLTEKVTVLLEQNDLFRVENAKIKQHYKELNNREAHLDYLKHLKESVATPREIVKEARAERPLDRSLASACLYTKHSYELLEYLVGTCPKDFNKRDKTQGCSKHMTGDSSRLRNFVKKFIGTVRFRNDHFGAIMGYGDYLIGDSVIFRLFGHSGLIIPLHSGLIIPLHSGLIIPLHSGLITYPHSDKMADVNVPAPAPIRSKDQLLGIKCSKIFPLLCSVKDALMSVKDILTAAVKEILIVSQSVTKLETLKEEKEGVDGKLAGLLTASKDLDNLIGSQRSDKNKEGLGYSVVPPPIAQIYSSSKKDLSWTGLPEFADDTITDYSRPSPAIESTSDDAQNKNPFDTETGASDSTILSKHAIKFVKAVDRAAERSTTTKDKAVKKSSVRYAKLYRKPLKKPNVRGNQRNWNNLKSHQLGPNFVMKKKTCFNCGDFNHLAYDCRKRVKKGTSISQNKTHESFTPKPVVYRPYRPSQRPVRTNMNGARPNRTTFNKQAHSYANRPFQRTSAVRP
nr:integrase, catalytic region, zinc finger, CCHC-type, peptidase aspartic, catalytic [Tanacetum cinerariifolium]